METPKSSEHMVCEINTELFGGVPAMATIVFTV